MIGRVFGSGLMATITCKIWAVIWVDSSANMRALARLIVELSIDVGVLYLAFIVALFGRF